MEIWHAVSWPTLGHIGTAVAAIASIVGLIYAIVSSKRQQDRQTADDIRRQLLALSHQVRTVDEMLDNQALIDTVSVSIIDDWRARIEEAHSSYSPEEFWTYIKDNRSFVGAIASEAWHEQVRAQQLESAMAALLQAAHRLVGAYSLLRESLGVLRTNMNHVYSPRLFTEIFEVVMKNEAQVQDEIPTTMSGFVELLQVGAKAQMQHYREFRSLVTTHIENSVRCVVALPDRDLIKLARVQTRRYDTHTEDIRQFAQLVNRIAGGRGRSECSEIASSADKLDQALKNMKQTLQDMNQERK